MKIKGISLIFMGVILFGTSACSTWRKLNNTEKGAVIGGGTGAVVGEAVGGGTGALIGGAGGAVGGGLIGHEIDQDERDRRRR